MALLKNLTIAFSVLCLTAVDAFSGKSSPCSFEDVDITGYSRTSAQGNAAQAADTDQHGGSVYQPSDSMVLSDWSALISTHPLLERVGEDFLSNCMGLKSIAPVD